MRHHRCHASCHPQLSRLFACVGFAAGFVSTPIDAGPSGNMEQNEIHPRFGTSCLRAACLLRLLFFPSVTGSCPFRIKRACTGSVYIHSLSPRCSNSPPPSQITTLSVCRRHLEAASTGTTLTSTRAIPARSPDCAISNPQHLRP